MSQYFKLDTNNVLGLDYGLYVEAVKALAISKPSEYYELRREVLMKVKADAIGNLYNTFFAVLSEGKDLAGNPIGMLGKDKLIPKYPSQDINNFSIQAASHLSEYINKCVDIILPSDFEKLSANGLKIQGHAARIDPVPSV